MTLRKQWCQPCEILDRGTSSLKRGEVILLALLPPVGARVRACHVVERGGLSTALAWGTLAIMACEGASDPGADWPTDPYAAGEDPVDSLTYKH